MEIRKEIPGPDADCEYAKAYGVWDDGLRHQWYDTREEALVGAEKLLADAKGDAKRLTQEAEDAEDRVEELQHDITTLRRAN